VSVERPATNFAAIRLIAAGMVVLGHSFVLAGAVPPAVLGTPIHVLAVRIFFVVSGYLVCGSWLSDPAPLRFIRRRALRIMPALVAVVVLTVAILGPSMTTLPIVVYAHHPETAAYLWNLVLAPRFALPGVFDDGRAFTAVNGSLWSLPVEVVMYALLPLYAWRWVVPAVAVAAIAASIAFTVIWPNQVQPVVWDTSIPFGLRFAADFVMGALVCVWRLQRLLSLRVAVLGLVAAQIAAVSPLAVGLISAVALPYAILAFALQRRPLFGWLDRRADLSYGIYLGGGPVQQVALSALGAGVGWAGLTAAAAPAIAGLAACSWYMVERPALRWKPRRALLQAASVTSAG
jgi:peptidoglycan/LPS O-acetylase OafA/YrhL